MDLSNKFFYSNKDKEDNKIIPLYSNLFTKINSEFLLPLDIIELKDDNQDQDASLDSPNAVQAASLVIQYSIKNCKNLVYNFNQIMNKEYINNYYKNLYPKSGLNSEIIDRFVVMKEYNNPIGEEKKIISECNSLDLNINYLPKSKGKTSKKVYQKLEDGKYRELLNYPDNDFTRNTENINYNLYITNWENKMILSQIRKGFVTKKPVNLSAIGKIKNNIQTKKMYVSDAIFNAFYTSNMTDEEILSKLSYSYNIESSLRKKEALLFFDNPKNLKGLL